jgi:uncharacterized protein
VKFFLVLVVVFVVFWVLRSVLHNRAKPPSRASSKSESEAMPQPMVTCAHCGVHLPRDEALPGRGGVFCDNKHRTEFETTHVDS